VHHLYVINKGYILSPMSSYRLPRCLVVI